MLPLISIALDQETRNPTVHGEFTKLNAVDSVYFSERNIPHINWCVDTFSERNIPHINALLAKFHP